MLEPRLLRRIMAIANQKGGVGKTTTALNLAAALGDASRKTLLIDLDPQGNATTGLGISETQRLKTSYDILVDGHRLSDAITKTGIENVDVIPATVDLSSADIDLADLPRRTFRLHDAIENEQGLPYDFILLDCPPSLSLITLNAITAADSVLVPLQSEFFALEGLSQLLGTIRAIRKSTNPRLRIEGVVLTMYDVRNNLSRLVMEDVRKTLGSLVFETVIPRNVKISEAPSYGLSVHVYAPTSSGSRAYRLLAREYMKRYPCPRRGTEHG